MLIVKYIYLLFRTMESSFHAMTVFILLSLVTLTVLHHFMKARWEMVWCALCAVPLLSFLAFYYHNRIIGMPELTLQRYAALGVTSLLIFLWGTVVFFKRSYKAYSILTYVFSIGWIILGIIFVAVCVTYVYVGNHSHDSWEESFSKTIDDLGTAYVLRDWKELDLEALKEKYLPMVREAEEKQDKAAMLMALYELRYDLYDGHVRVRTTNSAANQEAIQRLAGNDYGFSLFRDKEGEYLAILVEEGCDASQLGIQNGTVITKWDGIPIGEAASTVKCIDAHYAFSYVENERIFQPIFLAGHGGDEIQVTFLDENAKEKTVTVNAIGNYLQRRTEAIKKFFGTPADNENFHVCMISDGVGYLRITEESYKNDPPLDVIKDCLDGYSKELYAELDGKLKSLSGQGMKQLIIDLRNNDGGYSSLTRSVVALFSDQPLPSDMGYYRNGSYRSLFPVRTYGTGSWKDLPLIVLVNGDTGSSGDVLAYYLQTYASATLIGDSTTWGCAQCTGGYSVLTDGEFSFTYPIATSPGEDHLPLIDARSDRKARIIPDELIAYDKAEVLELFGDTGRDLILEKVLEKK